MKMDSKLTLDLIGVPLELPIDLDDLLLSKIRTSKEPFNLNRNHLQLLKLSYSSLYPYNKEEEERDKVKRDSQIRTR
jgi:hypothetical protein